MSITRDFSKRIGSVFIPVADTVAVSDQVSAAPTMQASLASQTGTGPVLLPTCKTTLKEGCYTISFVPKSTITIFGPRFAGTLRVENLAGGSIRFSGDLYSAPLIIVANPGVLTTADRVDRIRVANQDSPQNGATMDAPGVIPIRPRKNYSSYLKGTAANLTSIRFPGFPCSFSLDFDEFKYNQPATGFSGSFPAAATRQLRFALSSTATPDLYSGRLMQGTTVGVAELPACEPLDLPFGGRRESSGVGAGVWRRGRRFRERVQVGGMGLIVQLRGRYSAAAESGGSTGSETVLEPGERGHTDVIDSGIQSGGPGYGVAGVPDGDSGENRVLARADVRHGERQPEQHSARGRGDAQP
jgi:hypothetical protein